MSHCFTWITQWTALPSAGKVIHSSRDVAAGWKAAAHGQERDKGCAAFRSVNEGVEEGSEL